MLVKAILQMPICHILFDALCVIQLLSLSFSDLVLATLCTFQWQNRPSKPLRIEVCGERRYHQPFNEALFPSKKGKVAGGRPRAVKHSGHVQKRGKSEKKHKDQTDTCNCKQTENSVRSY
jgi:hypothetical protein